jgi:hypothetical protein
MPAVKTALGLLLLASFLNGCSAADTTSKEASPATASPAPQQADEAAALDAVRKTAEAQAIHFKLNRRYALTFDELVEARLLNTEPKAAGYELRLRPAADAQTYRLQAVPSDSAARHLFADQTGVVRAETGKEATAESSEVQ